MGRIKITAEYTHEETAEEKEVLLEGAKGVKKRVRHPASVNWNQCAAADALHADR